MSRDTLSEESIANDILKLFSTCNNMFLSSEMYSKDKNKLLISQKEKLEHGEQTLFKTTYFKLINDNEEELCIKVMSNRGNRDYLLDPLCRSEVF